MAILVMLAVMFVVVLFGLSTMAGERMSRLDNDPDQQAVLEALVAVGEDARNMPEAMATLYTLSFKQAWSPRDVSDRVVHALKLIRVFASTPVFNSARTFGKAFVVNYERPHEVMVAYFSER